MCRDQSSASGCRRVHSLCEKRSYCCQVTKLNYPDVSAESLMITFGFRGVQFGNYLPLVERQAYVSNTYFALETLASILGMPNVWIGGRKLGLSFGARGHGYASAHYERELHVINLTRFNGPGSIAHEVFHALDARMSLSCLGENDLLSELIINNRVNTATIDTRLRDRFRAFNCIVSECTEPSEYTRNASRLGAQKGGRKYWQTPAELCARAFEAYIEDCLLVEFGIEKQWLAKGTRPSDYADNGMHPYPIGEDRIRIATAMKTNLIIAFGL